MCELCRAFQLDEASKVRDFECSDVIASSGTVGDSTEAAPTPVFSNDQIANQLTNGYWGGSARSFNVGVGGTISVNITGLTTAGQSLARNALELWSDATGLSFSYTGGSAQITFDDSEANTAYNSSSISGSTINGSYINVGTAWIDYYGSSLNTYSFQTYIHEIGHALGLGHAGNYNGSATYGIDNHYANDSWQASVMSYFSQKENTYVNASHVYAVSPQVADVIAIRNLYGTAGATRTGNTTYGDSASSGDLVQTISGMSSYISMTIVDDGGIDTLDFSSQFVDQTIDLNEEAISSVRGYTGNLAIARGSVLENAVGGSGNDILYGNNSDNALYGGDGQDTLTGGGGHDVLKGGAGIDTLDGGSGSDWVFYDNSGSAVYVNLSDGQTESGGDAQGDILSNIEHILGSSFGDMLTGSAESNYIMGLDGHDVLNGGAGSDTLDGGAGSDWVFFDASVSAVQVNLSDELTEGGGDAGGDTLLNIEHLLGSVYGDTLTGSAENNYLSGHDGHDVLDGRAGSDTLDGGVGSDWAFYDNSGAAVYVNMSDGETESGGHAQGDTLLNIEHLLGSAFDDMLTGNAASNYVSGQDGHDFLNGGMGADTLNGGQGSDWAVYETSAAAVQITLADGLTEHGGDAQGDTLLNIEHLFGSSFDDSLSGDAGNNYISGHGGNDTLNGGLGSDTLDGGTGDDVLTGGEGQDVFSFLVAAGTDLITDFQDGVDMIEIGMGLSSVLDLSILDVDSDTLISFGGNSITLQNFDPGLLSADDFHFV